LPATYTNPGGLTDKFFIPDAEYKALNGVAQNADTIDGYTGYATNLCSGGTCPGFTAFVEHEIAHAMGRVDWAFSTGPGIGTTGGAPPFLTTLDFFKYNHGTGKPDPTFVQTYFSYDGGASNPGVRTFSDTSNSSDWIGFPDDSYNFEVAQGASVSTADILEMCALGWNDSAVCVPEPGTLALLCTSLLGFAALRRRRTELLSFYDRDDASREAG
jgi:hypothetical protein